MSYFMKQTIQVHISKGETHYVAECLNLPVVTQGKTLDELMGNLQEAVALQLEDEDPATFDLVTRPAIIANIEIENREYA